MRNHNIFNSVPKRNKLYLCFCCIIVLIALYNVTSRPSIPSDTPNIIYNVSQILSEFDSEEYFQSNISASHYSVEYEFPSNIVLTIAIISNNRLTPLKRLCNSLLQLQNPKNRNIRVSFNLEASSSPQVIAYVLAFDWPYGEKMIKKRLTQGGLINAVTESWYPSSNNDYGIILEDDIEISPFALVWIEKVLASHLNHPRIIGISLYSPRVTETVNPIRLFESNAITYAITGDSYAPYLMQTPCSWGMLFFPQHWTEFLSYMQYRVQTLEQKPPTLIPSRTNGWKSSWKKFLFELMWIKGYFALYPNFPNQESLSTNHMEVGEHISASEASHQLVPLNHRAEYITVPLIQINNTHSIDALKDLHLKNFDATPHLNLEGDPLYSSSQLQRYLHNAASINPRASAKREFDSKSYCKNFPYDTIKFIRENALSVKKNKITIFISTMSRYDTLMKQLEYYSQSPLVSTIIITWHNAAVPPPRSTVLRNTMVHFVAQTRDSLSNRFAPVMQAVTDAVLIIDDDMKIHLDDLHMLFEVWRRYPKHVVGFVPRWFGVDSKDKNKLLYSHVSEDPPLGSAPDTQAKEGYGIMLTKVMMVHVDYLYRYTCGEFTHAHSSALLKMVDENLNCEDLLFMGVVNHESFGHIDAPPLFVHPLNMMGDFGKGSSALHGRKNHNKIRSQCLQSINDMYQTFLGKTNSSNLRIQKNVVVSKYASEEKKKIVVGISPYIGHQVRMHTDCSSRTSHLQECSWEMLPPDNITRLDSLQFKWESKSDRTLRPSPGG